MIRLPLAFTIAALLALPAMAGDRRHDPRPDPQQAPEKSHSNRDVWRAIGLLGAVAGGIGLYYVLTDDDCKDCCAKKDEPKPEPKPAMLTPPAAQPATPKPALKTTIKPAVPQECEIPRPVKPKTTMGLGPVGDRTVGFVIGHEF